MQRCDKVGHTSRQEIERGDGELLGRSFELGGIGLGDASRREVGLVIGKYSGGLLSSIVLEVCLR